MQIKKLLFRKLVNLSMYQHLTKFSVSTLISSWHTCFFYLNIIFIYANFKANHQTSKVINAILRPIENLNIVLPKKIKNSLFILGNGDLKFEYCSIFFVLLPVTNRLWRQSLYVTIDVMLLHVLLFLFFFLLLFLTDCVDSCIDLYIKNQ